MSAREVAVRDPTEPRASAERLAAHDAPVAASQRHELRGSSRGAPRQDRRWLALAVLCVPLLIVSLDGTVLNVALPTLVRDLHATDSQLQWIVDAYALVFGGLMLVSGSLADRIGRQRAFCAGLAIFAACSVWAALSGSSGMLIAARASMGVGATMIMPATLSIITNTFRDHGERQRALGIWAATSGAGVALGPIVGGCLLAHLPWGAVFLINVPVALLGLVVRDPARPQLTRSQRPTPRRVRSAAVSRRPGLALWAVIEAPGHGWTSALVSERAPPDAHAGAVRGLEAHSKHPMLQLLFFRTRSFSGAVAGSATLMFGLFGSMFMLSQFLQFQLGYSALAAGVHMLPTAAGIAAVAPLSPHLVRRLGTKLTVVLGMLCVAGGLWQISGLTVTSTYVDQLAGAILIGVGTGVCWPACIGSLIGTLPPANTGVGSATNGTFAQVGSALGVAVVGSLLSTRYQHLLTNALAGHTMPTAIHSTILGSLGGALGVAEHVGGRTGAVLAAAARSAFISGFDLGLRAAAAVALAGVVMALIVLPTRATTHDQNEH